MRGLKVAGMLAVLVLAAGCVRTGGVVRRSGLPHTPVLLVHGYNAQPCPGADQGHAVWAGTTSAFSAAGWGGPVLPISFYACDSVGVDITGYGQHVPAGAGPASSDAPPRVHYDQNTSIDQLAHDLGWFVYQSYSRAGTPVDLVGISMGGLILRDLMYRVAHHDPAFPPSLRVTHVVTFSTPYLGYGGSGTSSICPVATVECRQFAVGSALITELNSDPEPPQGTGGTRWAAAGSSAGCDFVPATSSLALAGAQRIDYLRPCYTHTGYLSDADRNADATARVTRADGTATTSDTAPHSLSWLLSTLSAKR